MQYLARFAVGGESRGLARGCRKRPVAPAAPTAPAETNFQPRSIHIFEQQVVFFVINQRSRRDGDNQIVPVGAVLVGPLTTTSVAGDPIVSALFFFVLIHRFIHDKNYIAAAAAIAAVRPALGNVLSPPKANATVSAIAGLNPDFCFINEHFVWF